MTQTEYKRWKASGSARARDWAIATWAVVDTFKKMGAGWLGAAVVAVVMAAMMLYAIVVTIWPILAAIALAWIGGSFLKWYFDFKRIQKKEKEDEDEIPF